MLIALALLAPWIAPQNPYDLGQLDIMDNMLPPGARGFDGRLYLLGTDDQGRDMLSAILYGLRLSLFVGVTATVIALAIGTAVGTVAAYFGGRIDTVLMRLVDIQLSFPAILIALILLAILGKGVDKVVIALVSVQWAYYARTIRGSALVETRREYIEAAALPRFAAVAHHLPPPPAERLSAADRGGDRAGRPRHRARGDPVVPRRRRADHRAVARAADRQRLRLHALGQVLDRLLSRASRCSSRSSPSTWSATSCAT